MYTAQPRSSHDYALLLTDQVPKTHGCQNAAVTSQNLHWLVYNESQSLMQPSDVPAPGELDSLQAWSERNLTALVLSNNLLNGTLPSWWGDSLSWALLEDLELEGQNLTGISNAVTQ